MAAGISLFASPAMANSGIPMLAVLWPGLLVLLLPIIFVEAAWAKRRFGLEWKQAMWLSARANAISTVVGVPLAWAGMFLIEMVVPSLLVGAGIISNQPSENSPIVEHVFYTTVMAAWTPGEPAWYVPSAAATLLVPCYFISVVIEARSAQRNLPTVLPSAVRVWSWQANLMTYLPVAVTLIVVACWVAVTQT